ncbi:MAG: DEAD/DEAH box helicase family protein [Chloroflexi bacterium]|nr:DEAD/DEAH box helicase family protein [Chloroflexota bacterium]MBI3339445.1 DEAD/DEAH box helicase family protein [Chloroflexota bacterium]
MDSIVAIDIETTGLDEDRDTILEIAAVKFKGHRVEAEWSSLINPNRHIPEFITGLTGIDDAMVRQAPRLRDVIHELEAFAGNAPIVGHSVRFDLGFLQKQAGILQYNEVIDTYELASVLIPNASRYNLGSLGKELGILLPATHRALDDARVTQAVFNRLFEMANELPFELIAEIVRLSEPISWDAGWIFEQVLKAKAQDGIHAKKVKSNTRAFEDSDRFPPLENPETTIPLNTEEVASILEYGGPFSQYFESFEQRPEQVEMLRAVANALSTGQHLMVEAGTGVGKSFAYLVPAALFAVRNNMRVVVSTNTINLQDQLIKIDLPNLSQALNLDFRFSVLKGRANYLCPRRLENLRHFGPRTGEEMRVLAKVMVWQLNNQSGDRNELNLNGPSEREVWVRLSAEDDACTTETCIKRTGGACPFHRAKAASQTAHVLVVNHALLLSDIATGSKVLPEYSHLIVDEAHHLESATTNALSFRLTQIDLERMLKEIGGSNAGTLGRVLGETHETLRPSDFGLLQQKISRATDSAFRLEQLNRQFFDNLKDFADIQREGQAKSNYAWQSRVLPSTRTLPGWDEVEIAWDATGQALKFLLNQLAEIHKAASDLYSDGHENLEDVISDLGNVYRRLSEAEANVSAMISDPSAEQIYWIEVQPNGNRVSLNAAPLRVGPLIEEYLWHEKTSVILTSATLTTHGEFQYLRNTLGADEADEMQLGSPYDYESSTLLYIANDIPEPNQPGYQQALDRAIISTAKATGGRMLVLFTSYAALKKTSQAITAQLANEDIAVYEQGDGSSPNALLESFKSTDRAVLLGTRSFWEGVDVPGDSLSVVMMTKLPFDVPSDPIIAARSETYEDSFQEYYLPEAILKFRQGFGRLIRTASDRGVVAILDRRVLTKQYGRLFLESLPQCTARQGLTANLAREAGKWLGT